MTVEIDYCMSGMEVKNAESRLTGVGEEMDGWMTGMEVENTESWFVRVEFMGVEIDE